MGGIRARPITRRGVDHDDQDRLPERPQRARAELHRSGGDNPCFAVRLVGGQLSVSDESIEVRWVAPQAIEELPMHESIRLRIKHFLEHGPTPAIA